MARFRKKPVVVEAVQLLYSTWDEMCDFAGVGKLRDRKPEACYIGEDGYPLPDGQRSDTMGMAIPTLEGIHIAREYDWIIKGIKGELYSCKPDIFEATYESVFTVGAELLP